MAKHSVGAQDESHKNEASHTLMICFDKASPVKHCFVVDVDENDVTRIFDFLLVGLPSPVFHISSIM